MRVLKDVSIKQKLIRISLLTAGLAFIISALSLTINEVIVFKKSLLNELTTQTEIIGNNCAAALMFNDAKAAGEVLSALRANSNIDRALIYTKDGTLFADYSNDNTKHGVPRRQQKEDHRFSLNDVTVYHDIVLDNEVIGSIYIHSNLRALYANLLRYAGIFLAAIVFSLYFVYLLSSRFQKTITVPISELVGTMETISGDKDYSARAKVQSNDELGVLAEGFNEMLTQIQARDSELEAYRKDLEVLVDRRTGELKIANEQLKGELTERKQAEKTIERYNDELLALADASNVVLASTSAPVKLYGTICEIAVKNFGLKMAWMGLVVKDSYEVKITGQYPLDDEYLKNVKITWDDAPAGMGPTGMAMKTKSVQVVDDVQTDTRVTLWREKALKWGLYSSLTAPIITPEGDVMGSINLYNEETYFFTPQRQKIFQVFANQAATAIENALLLEGLEQKVSKRTQEFEAANRQLLAINKELALRRAEAETANRAKSDFLANMSHELRTPLNSIIGFSEIMYEGMVGACTDEQKGYLKDIWESGRHLLRLINDVLDLSKVEAGKMELELGEFNLKELIDRSLAQFREKAMKHNIKVRADIEEGLADIKADERKMRQVLFNLLSNAIKFTLDGGSVSVSARMVSDVVAIGRVDQEEGRGSASPLQDGKFIEIAVEDTGIGISPADLSRLFQPFQQLDITLTKKHEGTGLGLALSKKMVEIHGGRIWVESEAGKGSKFIFTIPVKP